MGINNVTLIGLTGMSGAGKSTACKVFEEKGFEIIDCDKLSRVIVEKGKPCLAEIAENFGQGVLTEDGQLNRRETARIIFGDYNKRLMLNGIMYPYISYIIINSAFFKKEKSFFLLDAPTLFESGIDDLCDYVVSVVADKEIVMNRIIERDELTEEEALARITSQHDKAFFIERSDFYAENNGDLQEFLAEIKEIINRVGSDK